MLFSHGLDCTTLRLVLLVVSARANGLRPLAEPWFESQLSVMILLDCRGALLLDHPVELLHNPYINLLSSHEIDLTASLILSGQEQLLGSQNELDFLLCGQYRVVEDFE